jgi:hypothetical protein
MVDPNAAWEAAEADTWYTYTLAKVDADDAFEAAEDSAWASYSTGLYMLETALASDEADIIDEFDDAALAAWEANAFDAWDEYETANLLLPDSPTWGERHYSPTAVDDPGVESFVGFDVGTRQEPEFVAQLSRSGRTQFGMIHFNAITDLPGTGERDFMFDINTTTGAHLYRRLTIEPQAGVAGVLCGMVADALTQDGYVFERDGNNLLIFGHKTPDGVFSRGVFSQLTTFGVRTGIGAREIPDIRMPRLTGVGGGVNINNSFPIQ